MNFLELFNRNFLIAAHRGASFLYPENTMSALIGCIGDCDFIEVDIVLSSDCVAVVIHDDTLSRTTNVKEIESFKNRETYNVWDFSFKELSRLDYGSWFYKGSSKQNRYEPLLTLRDTLRFIKNNKLFLNIEIKDIHENFSDEVVVSIVLKEIFDSNTQNQVMISSFRDKYLPLCKEMSPKLPTALLVEDKHPNNLIEYLKGLKVDAYNFDDALVDEEIIHKVRDAGFFVNIYIVNDLFRAKELFKMGVNAVFTDKIKRENIDV